MFEYKRRFSNTYILMFIGILLIGANLRAPITSIGVALPSIKAQLGISNSVASLITIVPLLAFATASLFAAKTGNRLGLERTIFFALILLVIGLIFRGITHIACLFIGTLLIGIGNAYSNVLTPAVIKGYFPHRIGLMTALYTVIMNLFGALSSFITEPLTKAFNYSISINLIIILTLITLVIWSSQLKNKPLKIEASSTEPINIWRSTLAWQITFFIGSQSLIFYSFLNWLPEYLSEKGVAISTSGTYLTILQLCLIPTTFLTPILIERMKRQVVVIVIAGYVWVRRFINDVAY